MAADILPNRKSASVARWVPAASGRFIAWCAGVAALITTLGLWLALGLGGPSVAQTVSNVALTAAAVGAAISCWARAAATSGRTRRSWALFGASALSWGLGQAVWTWYESILGIEVPFPSLADVGYLAAVPLMASALLMLPVASQSLANRARSVFDGLLVASSILLMSWILVLRPLISAGGDSLLGLSISLAYPIGDVVVVTIVVFMLARLRQTGAMPVPLPLLGTGLIAYAVSDSGFVYGTLTGTYASGALIDLGWFAGFLLIMLAGRKPAGARADDVDGSAGAGPLGVLLPYLAVSAALVTNVIDHLRVESGGSFVFWIRSVIIALMIGRQLLTVLENLSLTRHLEARVGQRTAELRASEQRFRALVQHSSDVVTVVDLDAVVIYQSESVTRVFGYPVHDLTGEPLTKVLALDSAVRLHEALQQAALRPYGTVVLELPISHRDGRLRQAEMTITNLLDDASVGGLVLNTRDISERKELEDQLVHEAFHDSLTALANRALFKDRVDQALRRRQTGPQPETVAVLFLDLDGFKEVNDSLGHASGDQLLIQVAQRLSSSVRSEDTVARFGGDEFAVLIERMTGGHEAEETARRLIDGLRHPFVIEGKELHVRASLGIALADPEAEDAHQLMRNADLAMYQAKADGFGGFTRFDPQMHHALVERLQLEHDLRRALEAGNELELHYQPTIELSTGELMGFEALARWRHPVRGLIPPVEFIPLAESTGLIRQLGSWVLDQACRQAVAWGMATAARPLTMSVNVSGRQFEQSELPSIVAMVLAETGLPAERLCLEMTESVLMNDTEENLALLTRLKEMGVRLAIDDFGTGYSSLSYLHRFPVDVLKIDRSFVDRLNQATDEAALARTIVQLGQSLGMVTVAEGIEQYDQFLALNRMTCEIGQGYYFSRPLPAEEAGRLLRAGAGDHTVATDPVGS
jgi:diguanylate cyclase (GGDEF)-like protein/PAS domain S-box-containing protein